MTKRNWIIFVVLCAFLPVFCASRAVVHSITRHHAKEGTVIALQYNPDSYIWIAGTTICTPIGTNGGESCTTIPGHMQYIPENWNVRVKDSTGTEDWHEVGRYIFEGCTLGNYWPGEDGSCREAK